MAAFMATAGQRRWWDVCSGSGGGALVMRRELAAAGVELEHLTLSDRYPNAVARQRVAAANDPRVEYLREPVDALAVPSHAPAVRTMFGALHHFPPVVVQRILAAAVHDGVPIAFVDLAASPGLRRMPAWLAPLAAIPNVVFLLLAPLLLTPLVRPFRWSRLAWTYLLPAIPIVFAWDGTVSALRAYLPEELLALARAVPGGDRYVWEVARAGRVLLLTGYRASR
jgi:hypothetical protein